VFGEEDVDDEHSPRGLAVRKTAFGIVAAAIFGVAVPAEIDADNPGRRF